MKKIMMLATIVLLCTTIKATALTDSILPTQKMFHRLKQLLLRYMMLSADPQDKIEIGTGCEHYLFPMQE